MRAASAVFAIVLAVTSAAQAQTSSVLDLLLPAPLRAGYQTRVWVREALPPPSDTLDDLDRLDMIWSRALDESDGRIDRALLASLIATFKHREIPFTFGITLPITVEGSEAFARRTAILPRHLYVDLPDGDDRDKLQHFFASAFLSWTLDNGALADLAGLGVEVGEDAFVRGGANDPRDVRTNRLGQLFAELLHTHPAATPGMMFRAWNRMYGGR